MSDYTGRHRPPTRAARRKLERRSRLPKSFSPAHALPTAAAVTLALTAAGATAVQSSAFAGEMSDSAGAALAVGGTSALLSDPQLHEEASIEVAATTRESTVLSERRRDASDDASREEERAARHEERKELEAKEKAEAEAAAEAAKPDWVRPVATGPITSGYGFRWGRMHEGIDYGIPVGTPLRAMGDGTVVGGGPMSGYGIYVDVQYADGTVSRYGHLSAITATVGQTVEAGDTVALSGNTGRSTGPHLHLEIRPGGGEPINPYGWLTERGIL